MVKQKLRVFAVSLATLAVGAFVLPGVSAAADKGLYIEGRAGATFAEDSQLDTTTTQQDAKFDTGWVGGVALGYDYGNGMRGEIGLDYRQGDVDKVGGTSASGKARAASLMISGYYDFFREDDFFRGSKIQPYIGAGIGVGFVDLDSVSPVSGSAIKDDDVDFAYQGMAGIAISVSPRTKVTLGYRYFTVPSLNLKTTGGASIDADYANHEIMLGVRFSFGAPKPMADPTPAAAAPALEPMPEEPPPPKPAAAPAPQPDPEISRNFLVFFDWNRANLTSLAQNIIRSAATEAKRVDKVRIKLTGHADRSGTSRYNQRLSMRRANAVRQRLQQLGIAANDIAVFAKGESEPLVSTSDGVREPQNRRVEIILE